MFYIIQENVFQEEGYDNLMSALERLELEYEIVKVLPFIEDFEFKTDRKDIFCFGSLKLVRLAQKYNWSPGTILTKNHNFNMYHLHYKGYLLNHDSIILPWAEAGSWPSNIWPMFIRPCEDTKIFNGRVFSSYKDWMEQCEALRVNKPAGLDEYTLIQYASLKKIQKEYRFWIINGKIATASQYKLGSRTVYDADVEPAATNFCKKMIDIFQLAPAFVMDICLANNKWHIVECGCINCAGFYKADMQKLLIALEDTQFD